MDINLSLLTKNYSLIKYLTLKSSFVPRVGEVICIEADEYFVLEVKYVLDDTNTLIPALRCREWFDGDRYLELSEQGWCQSEYKPVGQTH